MKLRAIKRRLCRRPRLWFFLFGPGVQMRVTGGWVLDRLPDGKVGRVEGFDLYITPASPPMRGMLDAAG